MIDLSNVPRVLSPEMMARTIYWAGRAVARRVERDFLHSAGRAKIVSWDLKAEIDRRFPSRWHEGMVFWQFTGTVSARRDRISWTAKVTIGASANGAEAERWKILEQEEEEMEAITNGYSWYIKGSPYDSDEDDIWTAGECQTREQAEREAAASATRQNAKVWVIIASFDRCEYVNPRTLWTGTVVSDTVIDGERVLTETTVGVDKPDNDDWRRERAMQAGMAFGCRGYNEVMGW